MRDQVKQSDLEDLESKGNQSAVRSLMQRSFLVVTLRVGRSFFVIPLLAPAEFGVFRFYLSIASYVIFFHGGALQTMSMRFAESEGRGDEENCQRLQLMSFYSVLIGGIAAVLYVYLFIVNQNIGSVILRPMLGVIAAAALISAYVQNSYRIRRNFRDLARNGLISDAAGFVLLLVGAIWFGLNGVLLAVGMGAVVSVWLGREWLKPPVKIQLPWSFIKQSGTFGGLLMVSSLLSQSLMTIDIILLKYFLPDEDPRLGIYALGVTGAGLITGLVGTVSQVKSQDLLFKFGRSGRNSDDSLSLLFRSMAIESLISVWLASGLAIGLSCVIPVALSQYLASLALVGPILAASVILRWKTYPVLWLNANSNIKMSILIPLVGVLGMAAHIATVHYHFNDSLIGYSFSALTGYILTVSVAFIFSFSVANCWSLGLRQVARMCAANSPVLLYLSFFLVPTQKLPFVAIALAIVVLLLSTLTYKLLFPGVFREASRLLLNAKVIGILNRTLKRKEH